MQQILNNLANIQLKLDKASGALVKVELLMRLIAEKHKPVRDALTKYTKKRYYECYLGPLCKAIVSVFSDKIEKSDLEKIKKFQILRHKLVHGNFVCLMELLDIEPEGLEIVPTKERNTKSNISKRGRKILIKPDKKKGEEKKKNFVFESLLSIDRNETFGRLHAKADEITNIIKRIYNLELN